MNISDLKPLTKKEQKYFGSDYKLKIIKQWDFNGISYSARRGTDDYIGIIEDGCYAPVGNHGTDYCFVESEIDILAKRLGVMD